jgi:WD40-like Beta Propeller Repeat
MKPLELKLLLFLFFIILSNGLFAQKKCDYNLLSKASYQANRGNLKGAIEILNLCTFKKPKCAEAFIKLADLYYKTGNGMYAISSITQAINVNEDEGVLAAKIICKQMQINENDALAYQLLTSVINSCNMQKSNIALLTTLKTQIKNLLALQIDKNTVGLQNMGFKINNNKNQNAPTFTLDGKTLIYTSVEKDINEDFYTSTFDTCEGWQLGKNIGYPPNTSAPDGNACLSADGYYLFFTRCDSHSENGYDGGGCDLIFSYKIDDTIWSSPQKFGATINSPAYEGQPSISSDNKTMYFVSDRVGGYGKKDIYCAKFVDGYWQKPVNLGPQINSTEDDFAPFIHADNTTLYFCSLGHAGMGGGDAFMSKLLKDSLWQTPKNLGFPINSKQNENSIYVTADGNTGYFSSDIINGFGGFDIYKFDLYNNIKPNPTHCVKGYVLDKFTKDHLKDYRIHIYDSSNNLLKAFTSNRGDGSYAFPLPHNNKYIITVDEQNEYKPFKTIIDLTKKQTSNNIYLNTPLKVSGTIDTLFKYFKTDSLITDTSLQFIKNNYKTWKNLDEDSVVIFCNYRYNNYVDTSMLTTHCFEDSAYLNLRKNLDSLMEQKTKYTLNYITFYKKYLKEIGFPEKNINVFEEQKYINSKQLFSIEISVVEYY